MHPPQHIFTPHAPAYPSASMAEIPDFLGGDPVLAAEFNNFVVNPFGFDDGTFGGYFGNA